MRLTRQVGATFKQAARHKKEEAEQLEIKERKEHLGLGIDTIPEPRGGTTWQSVPIVTVSKFFLSERWVMADVQDVMEQVKGGSWTPLSI